MVVVFIGHDLFGWGEEVEGSGGKRREAEGRKREGSEEERTLLLFGLCDLVKFFSGV